MTSFAQNISIPKVDKLVISTALLVSSYLVGVLCIGFGIMPELVDATALNLLLTFGLLVYHHEGGRRPILMFAAAAYVVGFVAEIVGVQYGVLFGEYSYGRVLGPKVLGTPFLIGVNWSILVLSVGVLLQRYIGQAPVWAKATTGAAILTAFDFIIEPVATTLQMWTWIGNTVPAQNYVGWFVVSFLLFTLFFKMKITGPNRIAGLCFGLLVFFFVSLNLCLETSVDIFEPTLTFLG